MRIGVIVAAGAAAVALGVGYRYGDVLWMGYGAPLWQKYAGGDPPAAQPAAASGGFAIPVEAVTVAVERVDLTIPAVGSLRSNESVVLSPEIAGRVVEIRGEEGQAVTAGTAVARLDQSVYQAEIAEIEANLELARANFKRADELMRKNAGTARARDEAEAEVRVDEAKLASAKARLEKTVIAAPFDGVLGLRSVSVGQYLAEGDAIFKLEAIDPLKVDFRVPEIYFGKVRIGQTIKVEVDALPGELVTGTVYAIDPLVDEQGRAIVVRATLPNKDRRLRPGLFARVALVYDTIASALLVPEQAIVPIGEDKFVFKVVNGKAALSKVTIGERFKGRAEIRQGLAAGDTVVTAGQMKIRDGADVTVLPASGSPQVGS
ncbi:MAG TPA: efflux RND transporter periplasmic adaptor subunit [Candidatus Acidoferrum sp.]|nr:efflux RND transporter periplasmic adaptor subunit [Candidatus Acidoferrum sp.]